MRTSALSNQYGLLGILLFFGAWQMVGSLHLAGPSVPSLTEVWATYREPWKLALLGRAAAATLTSAAFGLCAGTVIGTGIALVAHLVAPLRSGLDQLSVIVNAIPAVALGPILIVTVGRDWTPLTLAAIPVSFVMYISVSSGLRSANTRLQDVFQILGARRFVRLFYLEAPAALPTFLSGMRISVTAAIVGTIVGEWFGASTGLGIVILNTMLNFQIPLMWAAVLMAATTSLTAYGILGVCQRYLQERFS